MKYYSTNKNSAQVSFKEATIRGQAPDKGLYFPETPKPFRASGDGSHSRRRWRDAFISMREQWKPLPGRMRACCSPESHASKTNSNREMWWPLSARRDRRWLAESPTTPAWMQPNSWGSSLRTSIGWRRQETTMRL